MIILHPCQALFGSDPGPKAARLHYRESRNRHILVFITVKKSLESARQRPRLYARFMASPPRF